MTCDSAREMKPTISANEAVRGDAAKGCGSTTPPCHGNALRYVRGKDEPAQATTLDGVSRFVPRNTFEAWHAFADTAVACVESNAREEPSRQAVPAGGDLWSDEDRRPGVGARSALRGLTRRSCLSAVSKANAVSSATRPLAENRSAVGAQRRPRKHEPQAGTAWRDARALASSTNTVWSDAKALNPQASTAWRDAYTSTRNPRLVHDSHIVASRTQSPRRISVRTMRNGATE